MCVDCSCVCVSVCVFVCVCVCLRVFSWLDVDDVTSRVAMDFFESKHCEFRTRSDQPRISSLTLSTNQNTVDKIWLAPKITRWSREVVKN